MSTDEENKIQEQSIKYIYKPSENFCRELKDLRERKKLSQSELAKDLNVSLTSVQNWENGRRFPNDYSCAMIIYKFSLTEEETSLLFIVEEKTSEEEVAASEISDEDADLERTSAKPLIVIFKEQWLKVRKPFVIGVLAWLVMWGVIALVCAIFTIYPINRYKGGEPADSVVRVDIDFRELIIPLILSFIATIILAIVVHFIIKKNYS